VKRETSEPASPERTDIATSMNMRRRGGLGAMRGVRACVAGEDAVVVNRREVPLLIRDAAWQGFHVATINR
jgi:hypothetical protein